MKPKAPKILMFLLFFICFPTFGKVLGQDQLEWSITYKIEVRDDGSATWIIERKAPLATEMDIAIFWHYYASTASLNTFKNNIRAQVDGAIIATDRSMRAENFDLVASIYNETATGFTYGVAKYKFDWIGFAKVEDGQIIIGDVFEGKTGDLSSNDALIIKYPSGYMVSYVYPPPDETRKSEQTLLWYGLRNFGAGEPRVVVEKRTSNVLPIIVGAIALAGTVTVGLWFFKFREKGEEEIVGLVPPVTLGIEDEEEKIVTLLKAANGRLFQSNIIKQSGFSKSKTSLLLKAMEKKGIVRRQKRGREKLVMLTHKGIKEIKE